MKRIVFIFLWSMCYTGVITATVYECRKNLSAGYQQYKWAEIASIEDKKSVFFKNCYTSMAYLADNILAVGTDADRIEIYNTTNGKCICKLEGHNGVIQALVYNRLQRNIISASDDRTIKIWDRPYYKNITTLRGHTHRVTALLLLHPNILISGAQSVRCWNLETYSCTNTIGTGSLSVSSLIGLHNDRLLVTNSESPQATIWNTETNQLLHTVAVVDEPVGIVATRINSLHFAITAGNSIHLFDTRIRKTIGIYRGHTETIRRLACHHSGMLSGSLDSCVKLWDLRKQQCTDTFVQAAAVMALASGRNKNSFAVSSGNTVSIWKNCSIKNIS